MMRHARSIAFVLLAACGASASKSYVASTGMPASPSQSYGGAIAAEPGTTQGDTHVSYGVNPWTETSHDALSTFAADVDTASYTYARRTLLGNALPPPASVRVEEFVNYFKYSFPRPQPGSPFSVVMDAAPSPFAPGNHILRVGVATPAKSQAERKTANLVFLVDVSGSMDSPDKIGLAKKSLEILLSNLRESDTVSLVTYAGSTRVVLPATSVEKKDVIRRAINSLCTALSTGAPLSLRSCQARYSFSPQVYIRFLPGRFLAVRRLRRMSVTR